MTMELVDRYVLEVRRHLPGDIRDDVAREIGSSLDDAIDARVRETGSTADEAAVAVLKEFGSPKDIADSYLPQGLCLIGPRLYRPYIRTLKIGILGAYGIMIAFIFTYLLSGNVGPQLFFKAVVSATGRFPFRALVIFGLITAVFALIERFGSPKETAGEWDPESLPPLSGGKPVNRAGLIVHSFILVALLLLFNFAWQWIGVINNYDGQWIYVPIAGPGLLRMLIWIDFYLILALALNIIVLRSNTWHLAARIFRLALTAILGILLYKLAGTPDIVGIMPGWHGGASVPIEYPGLFETAVFPIVSGMVRTVLLITIIPVIISIVGQVVSLVKNR
jgi:hypothetical protein